MLPWAALPTLVSVYIDSGIMVYRMMLHNTPYTCPPLYTANNTRFATEASIGSFIYRNFSWQHHQFAVPIIMHALVQLKAALLKYNWYPYTWVAVIYTALPSMYIQGGVCIDSHACQPQHLMHSNRLGHYQIHTTPIQVDLRWCLSQLCVQLGHLVPTSQ